MIDRSSSTRPTGRGLDTAARDAAKRIVTASQDKTARLSRIFPSTKEIVAVARAVSPRCLTAEQRRQLELEGLVSKRRDQPYRAGRSKDWIKVKNRQHPAWVQDHL